MKDCDLCPLAFASNCTLMRHKKQIHKKSETELQIFTICEKVFAMKYDLDTLERKCNERKLKIQSISKNHTKSCHPCGKVYKTRQGLLNHNNRKQSICLYLRQGFSHSDDLSIMVTTKFCTPNRSSK